MCEWCLDLGLVAVLHMRPDPPKKMLMSCNCRHGTHYGRYLIPGYEDTQKLIKRIHFDDEFKQRMKDSTNGEFWIKEHKKLIEKSMNYWCDHLKDIG